MKTKKKSYPYPTRAADVPVTQRMLYEAKVDVRFHELTSHIHQMKILTEEQNAKNNIVLDGLVNLFERQDRLESR